MAKIDPQHRVHSTVASMVESRQRSASRAEADDWIERGWNPFLPQKSSSWTDSTAFELMVVDGSWTGWIAKHTELWPALARQAFKPGAQGKLDGRGLVAAAATRSWGPSPWSAPGDGDILDLMLGLGLDPDGSATQTRGGARPPPIFDATRHGAELLIAAGCSLSGRGPKGEGCWEHWAGRAMLRKLEIKDLDWLAERCPPSWTGRGSAPIGLSAIANRSAPIAQRLADAGAGPEAFGMQTPEGIAHALGILVAQADSASLLEIAGAVAGWDKTIDAFLQGHGMHAPIQSAIFLGRVKCLSLLERHGLLDPGRSSAEMLCEMGQESWRLSASASPRKPVPFAFMNSPPHAAGLAWALGRLPASRAALAVSVLESCVKSHPADTARLVQTCARKGFLPDSGPGSLRELYGDGDSWPGQVGSEGKILGFDAFTALCEDKSLRKALKPKAAKKPVPNRRL